MPGDENIDRCIIGKYIAIASVDGEEDQRHIRIQLRRRYILIYIHVSVEYHISITRLKTCFILNFINIKETIWLVHVLHIKTVIIK